ncbi:stage III sporulation protein AA [Metabacillus iocasae]|uniref:Stage III sporulation protein AA n=1 Tax=Priestia iocasae TaxID=2291674 RepID=A0ABS2QQ35_9BACI|nr:stage III sporulation protein AA [Metabacillus iocasae]MBM7701574.1 stage III sporulation protein AA [Metabacillus iocasae]
MLQEVMQVLPKSIEEAASRYIHSSANYLEEIRIRVDRQIEFIVNNRPYFHPYIATKEDALFILNKLSHFSIYMIEEELKKGYVTIEGGHRVGLAGKVITENGRVKVIRDVTSFNIRIAKQKIGIANKLIPFLHERKWMNTVLIGPPQTGKTTMVRDLARIMSLGVAEQRIQPVKVGIVDERSEIAGSVKGVPQHTFGTRLDVLDSCPKAEGMMMMIRSMSPDIIVVDEVGRQEDCDAVLEAVNAGVHVVMTVHGYDIEDLKKRPTIRELLNLEVFQRFIVLSNQNGPGTIKTIYNEAHKRIYTQQAVEGDVI